MAKGASTALLEYSEKMVTMKARTDLGLGSLQVFNALAKTSGTDFETMAKGVSIMEKAIGSGDAAFAKLGLSVNALKGMSADEAFAKVSTAVTSVGNAFERSAAGAAIFGKAFMQMLPALQEDLAAARQQAIDFGLVLSDTTLNAAEALGDKIDLAGMSVEAFGMRLAGMVAESPAVAAFFDGIARFFGSLAPLIESNKDVLLSLVRDGVNVATDAFVFLVKSITGAMSVLQAFRVGAAAMKGGWDTFVMGKGDSGEMDRLIRQWKDMDKLTDGVAANAEKFRKSVATAGGGGSSPAAAVHAGGGSFSGAVEIKVAELKVPNLPGLWMDLFGTGSQGKFGTLQGGTKNYNVWGDKSKFLPPELGGNIHVGSDGASATLTTGDRLDKMFGRLAQTMQALGPLAGNIGGKITGIFGGLSGMFGKDGLFKGMTSALKGGSFLDKIAGVGGFLGPAVSVLSGLFGLFKKKPKAPAPEPPKEASAASWASFTGDQLSKGAAGVLAGVSGIRVATPEDMAAQGAISSMVFWQTFKEKGIMAAAEAFRPVRDKMLETFKAAGASDEAIAALLGPMSAQIDLAGNDAFKGAAEGSKGFADALAAMANNQLPMTIDQFNAFQQQAVAGYEQMKQAAIDQGLSSEEAIKQAAIASGTYLTTLQDAAKKYGFDLNAGTTGVLSEAQNAGVAFAGSSQDRLIMSLDALTEAIGGAPPKFQQAINEGANSAGQRISAGGGGVNGGRGLDISEDGVGAATADALNPGLKETSDAIVAGVSAAIAALKFPDIVLDSGALAGAVAGAINAGNNSVKTALDGRG